jgi:hypothetical protein
LKKIRQGEGLGAEGISIIGNIVGELEEIRAEIAGLDGKLDRSN